MAKYIPIEGIVTYSDVARFWSKTQKIDNGCITWLGAKAGKTGHYKRLHPESEGKYGVFWFNGRMVRAHRFVLYMLSGQDPGESVDHWKCGNTLCINPEHIRGGTIADNNATKGDVVASQCKNGHERNKETGFYDKNNHWYCYPCHREADAKRYQKTYERFKSLKTNSSEMRDFARDPKLDWDKVKEIRRLYATEMKSQRQLARLFQVSQPMIGLIVRNEAWVQ